MTNSQHIGVWFAIFILGFLLSPLVRPAEKMESFIAMEISETKAAMGDDAGNMVIGFANALFTNTPLVALANIANDRKLTKSQTSLSAKVGGPGGMIMAASFNNYLQNLAMQSYVVAMRLAIVLFWLVFVLPMLAISIYDGIMQRNIKLSEFGAMRPATFTLAGFIVIPVVMVPIIYLVLPFHISPNLAPVWAACVALPLSVLMANSQPLFGR